MVVNKRKKSAKARAHTTHGYGSKKKHRGSGNQGGVGMAGTGKRADQKKTWVLAKIGTSYYGKHGFQRPQEIITKNKILNVHDLESFIEKKLVSKEGDSFVIDIEKLGFDKLLGKGFLKSKVKLIAPSVSKTAKRKIEEAGGVVVGATAE